MAFGTPNSETRQHILAAALKRFAHSGYSAASVQQIVDDAKVSKPALYYYFKDKAALFRALVHEAHDERYRLLQEAVTKHKDIRSILEEMLMVLFTYFAGNRDLMRISFSTMFAAPGEMPDDICHKDRCERNFEFVHSIIKRAQKSGELDAKFDSEELAAGFYGLANFFLMAELLMPSGKPSRKTAARVVDMFLSGAGGKKLK